MTEKIDIKKQFAAQAKKFRLHFGLAQEDVAKLMNYSQSEYADLEQGRTNYNVEKLEKVSSIYGLTYYQLGNPSTRFPSLSKLPFETIQAINAREKPLTVYRSLGLKSHVVRVMSTFALGKIFLPSTIFNDLDDKIQEDIKVPRRITDLLVKDLSDYVEKTGEINKVEGKRGRPEEYYKLIKKVPLSFVEETKKKK